jgi:hypothetical protein
MNGKANIGEIEADAPAGQIEAMPPHLYEQEHR